MPRKKIEPGHDVEHLSIHPSAVREVSGVTQIQHQETKHGTRIPES